MTNRVKTKLRSNSGASLMMALLLFIICAAIGAIVLTAGTVSSGRLANKAEMDERYYKVISAAEILKEELDGKDSLIIRKKDSSNGTDVYTFEAVGNAAGSDFLTDRTKELLASTENDIDMWNSDFYFANEGTRNTFKFNIVPDGLASTSVDIETVVSYGNMDLFVSDNNYTIRMVFTPVISEVDSVDGKIETKTATVRWVLNTVEKVYADE